MKIIVKNWLYYIALLFVDSIERKPNTVIFSFFFFFSIFSYKFTVHIVMIGTVFITKKPFYVVWYKGGRLKRIAYDTELVMGNNLPHFFVMTNQHHESQTSVTRKRIKLI